MEQKRKTLLEKYDIPINHLDFVYIKECSDKRELEQIVQILRSNEEGYYPDLTKCAESKLRELKPNSKLFRVEERILGRSALNREELKPIYDWTNDIKTKDNTLTQLAKNEEEKQKLDLPPVRKGGQIERKLEGNAKKPEQITNKTKMIERINSTDYRKWDQYDADEEVLRMELDEERIQEENEIRKRIDADKNEKIKNITKIETETKDMELVKTLTNLEREKLVEDFRLRGNEYFRAKEYDNAIMEYDRAIRLNPNVAAIYNNRAISYLKMKNYENAIEDCQQCLSLEPNNLKARLRHAEANFQFGRRREAYNLYEKVLEIDPQNVIALKAMQQIRSQLGELPPSNATRLTIVEGSNDVTNRLQNNTPNILKNQNISTHHKDFDLAKLVVPNRIVKQNVLPSNENIVDRVDQTQSHGLLLNRKKSEHELVLPNNLPKSLNNKMLIEEI